MKTDFDCYEALGVAWSKRSYQIVLLDSDRVRSLYSTEAQNARQRYKQERIQEHLEQLIEGLGVESAKAQGLRSPITSLMHLRTSDCRVYLYVERHAALGLLKVGPKRLFVANEDSPLIEINPLCVLDFYVHESRQRCGIGLALFEGMLSREEVQPSSIAYDRPSPKLLSFLRKHYGLHEYTPQANNFVVFSEYFSEARQPAENSSRKTRSIDAFSTPPRTRGLIASSGLSTDTATDVGLKSAATEDESACSSQNENSGELNQQRVEGGPSTKTNRSHTVTTTTGARSSVDASLARFERQHQREMMLLQKSLSESQKKLDSLHVSSYALRRPF
ncbi:Alpha-tubulin N-acetyltransferase 1 [Perkinsus olseni]|uniref:Alpha-tubulin N-acetyltransferase n=2 Tax=Perkinsus olseni TaxID=32597 RepID=A0A7J6MI78_PEROL|nr:Alpha-tubulin N-acetyltransferase 1 [Perkinsus olseni]